jgi:hypothetical protein
VVAKHVTPEERQAASHAGAKPADAGSQIRLANEIKGQSGLVRNNVTGLFRKARVWISEQRRNLIGRSF